jgi:hypothetical protein
MIRPEEISEKGLNTVYTKISFLTLTAAAAPVAAAVFLGLAGGAVCLPVQDN